MPRIRRRLLAVPRVKVIRDRGHRSIFVRLQRGKARFGTQPDPGALIFFYVDSDNVPVGIMFHEPVRCSEMVRALAEGVRRCPPGEPAVVERLLTAFEMAAERLPTAPPGAA